MTNRVGFDERCAQVGNLMDNRRNLNLSWMVAQQLVREHPNRARSYFLVNLVQCLGNFNGGARNTQRWIDGVQQCRDRTDQLEGDMQRDRAIGLIRYERTDTGFMLAERWIGKSAQLHAGNNNRLACLDGVRGRLAFARGQYPGAAKLHARADNQWSDMGEEADALWVYLNLVQWLRAVVAYEGPRSSYAGRLVRRIRHEVPPGQQSRMREARLLTAPFGLRTYALLERRRG